MRSLMSGLLRSSKSVYQGRRSMKDNLVLLLKIVFSLNLVPLAIPPSTLAESSAPLEIAHKELMKVTDQGLVPSEIVLEQNDSSVFLLNMLPNEKLNLTVEFGSKHMHCHSKNLAWDAEKGEMKTTTPVSPQDFAVLCFPESGVYPIVVESASGKKLKLSGTVKVGANQ